MTIANRRTALVTLAAAGAGAAALAMSRPTLAQTTPTESGDQSDYVNKTMTVGTLALRTSQIAADKAQNPMVKTFAGLEVGEQTAIATVLSSTQAGKTPPALSEDLAGKIESLNAMQAGADFDKAYIDGQIDGHRQLLDIQKTLSGEMTATVEVITAKLAEQAVTSHLAMLDYIKGALANPPA
jgi:putative membrane protein